MSGANGGAVVPGEALPAAEAWKTLTRDIRSSLKALLRGRARRDRRQVETDYDDGAWRSRLDLKPWRSCGDLREYVVPADQAVTIAQIGGRLVRVRTCDYYAYRAGMVQGVLKRYAGQERELVELGCGWGENLFTLCLAGRWERLAGFDISANAIQAGREAAEHFGVAGVSFGRLDLTDGGDPAFQEVRAKTVFTYYCLEQLKHSTAAVVENLLRAEPRRVVHIEPSHELLRLFSLMDWATRLYVARNDYQDNLLTTLRRFEKEGALRILGAERLHYAPTCRNDPTLICWEPKV